MKTNIRVFALGGLGEVGKNMYVVSVNEEMIVIDAGVLFADSNYGVNYIVNDVSFLRENEDKIKGVFITHGHEDHIGGIPYLFSELKHTPLYASGISVGLIENKLMEYPLLKIKIQEFQEDSVYKFDNFEVSFFRTTHSVPDSFGIAIKTKLGYILHTGDFKFDLTPLGKQTEFDKLTSYAKEKTLLLLSDSTNALVSKMSPSERTIGENINTLFSRIEGRIIISTFSSNIYRVNQIIKAAEANNRKVIVFGRSMAKNIEVARQMGYIECNDETFIGVEDYPHVKPENIVIICTGSQGEPLAALARMADGEHRYVKVSRGDTIIFSSSIIPGNLEGIQTIVNKLYKIGAEVIVNSNLLDTHTSGHASIEELKLMLNLTKPKYFMPIHGEYAMLKNHTYIAQMIGMNKDDTFVLDNGDVLEINEDEAKILEKAINAQDIYIDSSNEKITASTIKERRMMSEDGVVDISIIVDEEKNIQAIDSKIIGFMIHENLKGILSGLNIIAKEKYSGYVSKTKNYNEAYIKAQINNHAQKYLEELISRRVMVVTSIIKI